MKNLKIKREWGYYCVLYETANVKVKELVVDPGKSLSMQRHQYRNEYWHISEGVASVLTKIPTNPGSEDKIERNTLFLNHTIGIPIGRWHQLSNQTDKPLKIVEIQYGVKCEEEDIERQ
jgi:mannose-6-phosphate isomerase-like protein (cupin superfamily)